MPITIRDARPEDAERVREIMVAPHTMTGTMRTPHAPLQQIQERMSATEGKVKLSAILDGKVAGYAELFLAPEVPRHAHVGEINMVCVHADSLRKGVARALMSEMVRMGDDWLNLKRMELTVWADNSGAITLYEEFGFEIEGTMRSYIWRQGEYVDAHIMGRVR